VGVELRGEEDLVVQSADPAGFRRWIAPLARDLKCRLWEVSPLDEDLESVFRYLVEGR
jgi:ABC-2 type transport system ATP-binding protein